MVNAAAQYRRALEKKLRCGRDVKSRLLASFDSTLAAYLEELPDPVMDDLFAAFGPPEEMSVVLMAEVTSQEQMQYNKTTYLKKVLSIIVAITLVAFTIYIWFIKDCRITSSSEVQEIPIAYFETYEEPREGQSL